MRMLDLFCGRWGWSKAFAARGWECYGIDLVEYPAPAGCVFIQGDVMSIDEKFVSGFDFACASSPCEEFSVFGMAHFHPNPDYPERGIELFNHTRKILWKSGKPFVMENVRPAWKFVGPEQGQCGPFSLWGNAVPPILPQGITKGIDVGSSKLVKTMTPEEKRKYRAQFKWNQGWSTSKQRQRDTASAAEIPPELANCVADYAERIIAGGQTQRGSGAEPQTIVGRDPVEPAQRAESVEEN